MKVEGLVTDRLSRIEYRSPEVFRRLFREHFPKLLLFAQRYVNEREAAADIAQECYVRLWNCKAEFLSDEKVVGFLYTTARHLSLDHIKHSGVVSAHEQQLPEQSELFYQETVNEEETYEKVYRAIDRLSPQSRNVILLTLEGKSNPEIAEILHITVNSVRTHKQSAYKKLKSLLQENFLYFLFLCGR